MVCARTTVDIPDTVFRQAKAKAAEQGIPLHQFVSEAVKEKLGASSRGEDKPWVKLAGGLRHLRKESARIRQVIEDEFEKIEPDPRAR
ncbi:MAG: hypothetical protein ACE141_14535 [Bryobacteraceae bacterium]